MATKTSKKKNSALTGTNAKDILTVKHTKITVNGLKGNDTIKINTGSNHRVYGGAGTDTITIGKSVKTGLKVYGDDVKSKLTGNDIFKINGGKKNYYYGGKGKDTFTINAGTSNYLYGGAGVDTFVIGKASTGTAIVKDFTASDKVKVTGNTSNIYASKNNIIIKGGKSGKAALTLVNAKKLKNSFTVTDSNSSLYTYKVSSGVVGVTLKEKVASYSAASFVTVIDASKVTTNSVTVTGNAKANTIYVANINGGTYQGGAGKDTFTINGGSNHIIETGDGKDTVTINTGSGHQIKNTGNGGNDVITINKNAGDNIKITGHSSAGETVKIYGGSNHNVSLSHGANKVTVAGGINHNVYTGDNDDTITLTGTSTHVSNIHTGAGKDTVTIKNGAFVNNNSFDSHKSIETGDGDDKVYIEANAGDGTYVTTGAGDDGIYVRGGKNHSIYANSGNDVIEVTGGSGHDIHLESGRNTVTISAKDLTLHTSSLAADSITLNWGTDRGMYTIYATRNSSAAVKDVLKINSANSTDFSFEVQNHDYGMNQSLIMTGDSGTILINMWMRNKEYTSFNGITFADKTLSFDQINKNAGYNV